MDCPADQRPEEPPGVSPGPNEGPLIRESMLLCNVGLFSPTLPAFGITRWAAPSTGGS